MCHDVLYIGCVKWMLLDDLIVFDCDFINIESSTEGKEEKKRVWTKRKDNEKNQMLSHWCFWFTMNALMCEAWKQESVWIRWGWWWKSGRQGEKSGRKRGGKKGKREKVVLGKVLFVFVDCVFASSLFPCTHTITPHVTNPDDVTSEIRWSLNSH